MIPGKVLKVQKALCLAMICTWMMAGCSPLDAKYKNKEPKAKSLGQANPEAPLPPVYSDFKDVLVLGELTEDKRHSSVILQGETGTGFMAYFGRVEIQSVVTFFAIKMPQDGWKPITVQKSPFSTIMIFSKEKRWCTITIREKGFTTEVQIGVAPEINKE